MLFISLASVIWAQNDDVAQLAVALAKTGVEVYAAEKQYQTSMPTQKNHIKHICWLFEHNPYFYKLKEYQENMDYTIAVFKDHIAKLESKIASKQSGLESKGMFEGAFCSLITALSACSSYYFFNERKAVLSEGKSILTLDRPSEKSLDFMIATVSTVGVSAVFAAFAAHGFYKVYRYQQRLQERLERDKKILALLEREKAALDSKKMSDTTKVAVNKLVDTIVTAINGIVENAQ